MMPLDFLVNELHDEHRDREWVDAYGYHWAWCENQWVWRLGPKEATQYPPGYPCTMWTKPSDPNAVNQPRGDDYGPPGPFMEAMHHKLLWG